MFLTDITKYLIELNLRLQGHSQTALELFEYWKGLATKLSIFISVINTSTYKYFPNVKAFANKSTIDKGELIIYDDALKDYFPKDAKTLKPICLYFPSLQNQF